MLNQMSRTWLVGGWLVALALVATVSMSMAANLSTTVMLVALGVAPGVVIVLLKRSAAAPTVAEILHAAQAEDGRR